MKVYFVVKFTRWNRKWALFHGYAYTSKIATDIKLLPMPTPAMSGVHFMDQLILRHMRARVSNWLVASGRSIGAYLKGAQSSGRCTSSLFPASNVFSTMPCLVLIRVRIQDLYTLRNAIYKARSVLEKGYKGLYIGISNDVGSKYFRQLPFSILGWARSSVWKSAIA